MEDIFKEDNNGEKLRLLPKYLVVILCIFAVIGSLVGGIFIGLSINNITKEEKAMVDDMPLLSDVYAIIDKYYYKDVDWKELEKYASAGMAGALDKFSGISIIEPQSLTPAMGVTLRANINNKYFISDITEGSPADIAVGDTIDFATGDIIGSKNISLDRGDEILFANGIEISGMSMDNLQKVINEKLYVELIFKKAKIKDTDKVVYGKVSVIKTIFLQSSESSYSTVIDEFGNRSGYIKLNSFTGNAAEDFKKSADLFMEDSASKKLILDLRNNGGGDVNILAKIAAYFIPNNYDKEVIKIDQKVGEAIVKTLPIEGQENKNVYFGAAENKGAEYKLAILTNENSASASEALVGAIRYYDKTAVVIGAPTYGKGVAQGTYKVSDTMYLSLTIGYFYVPITNGDKMSWKSYHDQPMVPDYNFRDSDKVDKNYGKMYPLSALHLEAEVAKALIMLN